jgi:hypothetical protein
VTSPYREEKPLTEIIPPDRRRLKAAGLVVLSMIAGALLLHLARELIQAWELASTPTFDRPPTPTVARRGVTLRGPNGTQVVPPPGTKSVVHVWLQGCADCMPAFEAMRELSHTGGLGVTVPVINVSYGDASPLWAGSYGVLENLVHDQAGTAIVRPNGIGTFTTLVFDENGRVIHRDRPDRVGYRERIRAAVGPGHATLEPTPEPPPRPGDPIDTAIERVVAKHRTALHRQCFERMGRATDVKLKAHVTLGAAGEILALFTTGDHPEVNKCVENEVRLWKFPPVPGNTYVEIPFEFHRQ